MRIAVLVKQVPRAEEMELVDGRLRRDDVELEMNAYCRRAVSKGVELARISDHGWCSVFTLGPPSAEDVLREAVAWGADEGIHLCDPAFAGSDTLATALTLAAALRREGPFDLILVGRNSIDSDTGQVGPEVAELLDLPFLGAVRTLSVDGSLACATCELDDGWCRTEVSLPAVLSTAERLTEPCKVEPAGRVAVGARQLRRFSAADLGIGPWGASASATVVSGIRTIEVSRRHQVLCGSVEDQVAKGVRLLREWGALDATGNSEVGTVSTSFAERPRIGLVVAPRRSPKRESGAPPLVAVVLENGRQRMGRELLGEAAELANHLDGEVVALGSSLDDLDDLARWGADRAVRLDGVSAAEDTAVAVSNWCEKNRPWGLLTAGTLWGREVAARVSVRATAGLTGDAVGLSVEGGRLLALKPAFGGKLVAVIEATSALQMATVRPGILPLRTPRLAGSAIQVEALGTQSRKRVRVLEQRNDDDVEALVGARAVVGVGQGVGPDRYAELKPLLEVLGAELAASRKVTDKGWLPRSRQVGITGHSIAPSLYIAIGISGKFNHMVGVRAAGTLLVVNSDPQAPAFDWADVGIVGDWEEVVPLLVDEIRRVHDAPSFVMPA